MKVYEIVCGDDKPIIVESEEVAKAFCDKMNAAVKLDVRIKGDVYCYHELEILNEEPKGFVSFVVGFMKGSLTDPCIQCFNDHNFHRGDITILADTINVCFSVLSAETMTKDTIIKKAKDLLMRK
jgi:hypothetical protein